MTVSKAENNTDALTNAAKALVLAASEQIQVDTVATLSTLRVASLDSLEELRNLHNLSLKHLPPVTERLDIIAKKADALTLALETLNSTQKAVLSKTTELVEEARIRRLQWAIKNYELFLTNNELNGRDAQNISFTGKDYIRTILVGFLQNNGQYIVGRKGLLTVHYYDDPSLGSEADFQKLVVDKIHAITGKKPAIRPAACGKLAIFQS